MVGVRAWLGGRFCRLSVVRWVWWCLFIRVRQLDAPEGGPQIRAAVIEIGRARCLIRRSRHGPGGDLNPFNQATDECQRTGADATVFAHVEGDEASTAQRQVVDVTDAAFVLIS